ncbi:sugar ABC transporter permease [Marmoricola endophyticus]|uniref:Sugar ABC transporter permease n=1 Tax=Marmoricola endophyticus TaxID=2040280 RepID=A0A917F5V7_9ACTN|nr:ABC transporter permease [Marmoricola endophyticus]GGF51118.1 sugar ABC transporter permease [Marmoricola endophyticus]
MSAPTTASTVDAGAAAPTRRRGEAVAELFSQHGAVAVLVLLLVVGSLAFDTFGTVDNLSNVAVQGSFLAIVALGVTFVILTGGIDLSVGSVFALGGVLAAYGSGGGWLTAILLPVAVGALIGLVQGGLVAYAGMAPFIVTLAGLLGARGLVFAITDEGNTTPKVKSEAFVSLGQGHVWEATWPVVIMLALFAVGWVVRQRSRAGQVVVATGGGEDASRLMGLPVARVKLGVYVASGMLAAFAGALNAARSSSGVTTVGVGMELEAISAVVIGGTLLSGGRGNVTGTLAGVYLLGVIQNLINQVGSLTSSIQSVVSGGFLLVVVILQTLLSPSRKT